ncbi:putative dehydrogenase [Planctomycetales bacterium 10988]|nr:putative dehydrogenase [Planctomycetales bacterium 10988]
MSNQFNRRSFIAASAAAGAYTMARPILGSQKTTERLQVAFIGTGNQGMGLLKRVLNFDLADVVAVCDVNEGSYGYKDADHFYGREPAKQFVNDTMAKRKNRGSWKGCESYQDFRDVLARDDVDAVFLVVPDHWHSIMSIMAAKAGKHVYCEKPLSLCVAEGRDIINVVNETGIVFQTGSHERSRPATQFICEAVRNGAIGEVKKVKTVVGFNNKIGPGPGWQPEKVPSNFDYGMWLGPAPHEPYHHDRCLYRFRFHYDYSGGQITNFGAHSCDMAQWGLNRSTGGPVEIVCDSAEFLPEGSLFTTATETKFRCTYADGVELECISSEPKVQARFEGTDGWMQIGYAGYSASRDELLKGAPPYRAKKGEIDAHSLHMRNFVRACTGDEELAANAETGHASATLCHIANTAIRRFPQYGAQPLQWDPKEESFVGNEEANQTLRRPQRTDWMTG